MQKLLTYLFISSISFNYCQGQIKNNEAWASASASFDLIKKVDFNTSFSSRFKNNGSQLNSYNYELGLSYKINDRWKTALDYRFTNKLDTYANRMSAEIKWSDEIIKRNELKFRTRLQQTWNLDKEHETEIRTKLELCHKIRKTKFYPTIFTEFFYSIKPMPTQFENIRIGSSIDFKQLDNHTFSIGYFKSIGLNQEFNKNRNIFTLDYKINL